MHDTYESFYQKPEGLQAEEQFPEGDILGQGTFGVVYLREALTQQSSSIE